MSAPTATGGDVSLPSHRQRHRAGVVRIPLVGELVPRRQVVVTALLAAVAVLAGLVALGIGDLPLSVPEVLTAAFTDQGFTSTVVLQWRLPRVLGALMFGAALAVSGAIFQSLTNNPLGSPDIIGFVTGSYTGVLVVSTVLGSAYVSTAFGALAGGLLTALAVYLLAYRGGLQGFRLIIVGIAVTAVLQAVNTWLLLRVENEVAMAASIWGAGSISLLGWGQVLPAAVAFVVLSPLALLAQARRQLEIGDDAARAHGVRLEPVRLVLLVGGVALTAVVTAAAGPIAFVALAAPQIAQRLTRSAGLPLLPSAATGAVLLLAADLVAQHLIPGGAVPVGMVTVVVGGTYLLVLLVAQARRQL